MPFSTATKRDASLPARDYYAYVPLIATAFISALAAHVLKLTYATPFIQVFLGLWLTQFALVKFFDIEEFTARFGQYDIFAMQVKSYAFVFPFLQLALGLAYLADYLPDYTSILLGILAVINLVGIFRQVQHDTLFNGTYATGFHQTPLRDAAIMENTLMLFMALGYFLTHKLPYFTILSP